MVVPCLKDLQGLINEVKSMLSSMDDDGEISMGGLGEGPKWKWRPSIPI